MLEPANELEERIISLCRLLRRLPDGYLGREEFLRTLRELESIGCFATAKINSLRRMMAQKRIDNLDRWHHFILMDVGGVETLGTMYARELRSRNLPWRDPSGRSPGSS